MNGSSDPVCANLPPFSEEGDSPILGVLPNGEWIQFTPTIIFEDNGPSINDQDRSSNVLTDGGGSSFVQTNEAMKCSNVLRSFVNEDTCFLSNEAQACAADQPVGEVLIEMNETNIIAFYDLASKYVYAIRGLVMEDLAEHPCNIEYSRWEREINATCSAPTPLETATTVALSDAIGTTFDAENRFIRDVRRTMTCDPLDVTISKLGIEIQVGDDCFTHVHRDHLNVYDFSGWVTKHPGGGEFLGHMQCHNGLQFR